MARAGIEELLTPLLERAASVSDAGLALIDSLRSDDATVGTLPEATVFRLHLVATATYDSGILCLRAPETSLGSYVLLRGLLEAWSHLAFIADDAAGGDPRCRALRYERGAMREWSEVLKDAPVYYDKVTWQAEHTSKERDLDALWREHRCSGSPRTWRQVSSTLRALAKEPMMEWIPGVWRATSAAVHMYGVDFVLRSRGGETELVWALPSQRATWLAFLVAAYGYVTATAGAILSRGDSRIIQFHDSTRTFIEDDELNRILRREYDG